MHFSRSLATLCLISNFAGPAYAQAPGREQAFATFWQETCFNTHSNFDAVTALAAANHWISIDPSTAPFKVQNEHHQDVLGQVAWNTDATPGAFVVFAIPPHDKTGGTCDVAAFDLDLDKVAEALTATGRFEDRMKLPLPVKFLHSDIGDIMVSRILISPQDKAKGHNGRVTINTPAQKVP